MSLYDDLSLDNKAEQVAGWSSSIKLLQTQMQLKKQTVIKPAPKQHFNQPRREAHPRKPTNVLAPVIDLKKSRRDIITNNDDDDNKTTSRFQPHREIKIHSPIRRISPPVLNNEQEWVWDDEYDPMWPNDYEKVIRDKKEIQDKEREKEDEERKKRHREDRDRKARESVRSRYDDEGRKGFPGRPATESDEEEEEVKPKPSSRSAGGGVAIAPPPSLQDSAGPSSSSLASATNGDSPPRQKTFSGESFGMGGSVAAKIMAKYGFKEGQGLGKKEQGISMALQVEKTSKRGGRIINETMMSSMTMNTFVTSTAPSSPPPMAQSLYNTMPPPSLPIENKPEPSITEIMKNPSKVVLLRNMVGPGEVDEDLEPEVKDECNTKYGDVIKVMIRELSNVEAEEAVRIFVEFSRIQSAIKAVVDLNGRFFGGRQVKAGFYDVDDFYKNKLL